MKMCSKKTFRRLDPQESTEYTADKAAELRYTEQDIQRLAGDKMSIRTEELCSHRWLTLCKGLHGEPFIREHGGGALIVPVRSNGEVLFITEPAIPDGSPVLWLPAGAMEPGETPGEAANRELQEEIGFKASRLDVLAELRPG